MNCSGNTIGMEYDCLGCGKRTLDTDFCSECYCCDNCDGLGGVCTNLTKNEKSTELHWLSNKQDGQVCIVSVIKTGHRSTNERHD